MKLCQQNVKNWTSVYNVEEISTEVSVPTSEPPGLNTPFLLVVQIS